MSPPPARQSSHLPGTSLVIALLIILLASCIWLKLTRPVIRDHDAQIVHAPAAPPVLPDARIDPNRASAAELMLLPGIGPMLAQGIVEDRERNGPFKSLADLARVRWVGPSIISRAGPFIAPDFATEIRVAAEAEWDAPD